jgi:hypothetical protein
MPILVRVGRISDLAPGECRSSKMRGRRLQICATSEGIVGVFGSRCSHTGGDGSKPCVHYRSQVRGGFVYVALDPVTNAAPADIHLSDRPPSPTSA